MLKRLWEIRPAIRDNNVLARRGNKAGQGSGVRVSKAKHSLSAGIYAVDFAVRPEKSATPRSPHRIVRRAPSPALATVAEVLNQP